MPSGAVRSNGGVIMGRQIGTDLDDGFADANMPAGGIRALRDDVPPLACWPAPTLTSQAR